MHPLVVVVCVFGLILGGVGFGLVLHEAGVFRWARGLWLDLHPKCFENARQGQIFLNVSGFKMLNLPENWTCNDRLQGPRGCTRQGWIMLDAREAIKFKYDIEHGNRMNVLRKPFLFERPLDMGFKNITLTLEDDAGTHRRTFTRDLLFPVPIEGDNIRAGSKAQAEWTLETVCRGDHCLRTHGFISLSILNATIAAKTVDCPPPAKDLQVGLVVDGRLI